MTFDTVAFAESVTVALEMAPASGNPEAPMNALSLAPGTPELPDESTHVAGSNHESLVAAPKFSPLAREAARSTSAHTTGAIRSWSDLRR